MIEFEPETQHRTETTLTAEQDTFWKEALDTYFENAIAFFFPVVHQDIDWKRGYEFLDKELEKITKDSETGKRFADKLVKVFLSDGTETWLLIHIEVQGYSDPEFEKRMFEYYYRIRDRYQAEVVSLALLTDASAKYRPGQYQVKRWGFSLTFEFPAVKVLDYYQNWVVLESNANPFAIIVMAHLKAQQEKQPQEQLNWKLRLVRELYHRAYSREQVIQLFQFLDWAINLPEKLELVFQEELSKLEEVEKMTYVTSIERKGIEKGKQEEAATLILRLLKRRVGEIGSEVEQQVSAMPLEKLEELGEALLDFTGASDLQNWLGKNIQDAPVQE